MLLLLAVLAAIEATLALLSAASPRLAAVLATQDSRLRRPDPILGSRPRVGVYDHDERGFRNRVGVDRAEVVAIGDSQTYGIGVDREAAWPARLETILGRTVYNMGFGGWGPYEYERLWDEASALEPKTILIAIYFGNDLYDAFHSVYNRPAGRALRSPREEVRQEIVRLEAEDPLDRRIEVLFNRSVTRIRWKRFLQPWTRHSRLTALAAAVYREVAHRSGIGGPTPLSGDRGRDGAGPLPVASNGIQTLLTPEYRLCGLDLDDPRIDEGLRLTVETIRRLATRARNERTRIVLLLLPTKERVFLDESIESGGLTLPPARAAVCRRLVEAEDQARQRILEVARERDILAIDLRPSLCRLLRLGIAPYPAGRDGHPLATGHQEIAEAVAGALLQCRAGRRLDAGADNPQRSRPENRLPARTQDRPGRARPQGCRRAGANRRLDGIRLPESNPDAHSQPRNNGADQ